MSGETFNVDHIISGLNAYIERSVSVLEKGDYVELHELNEMVQNLCECINSMPVEGAEGYAKEMDDIISKLDLLQQTMEQHQHAIKAQMNTLAENRQAASAYAKMNAMSTNNPYSGDDK